MRAKEFVNEETTEWPSDGKAALPNGLKWPALDNSSPYPAYRFGVALAGAPNYDMNKKGPVGQNMMTIGYTDADNEILQAAGKMMGVSGEPLTTEDSTEEDHTNTKSPVPQNSGKPRKKRA